MAVRLGHSDPQPKQRLSWRLFLSVAVIASLSAALRLPAGPPSTPTPPAPETPPPPNPPAAAPVIDHSAYDALLQKYVEGERVNYDAWMRNDEDRGALKKYLDRLAGVQPDALSKNERLAFDINLYNATMLEQVMEKLAPNSSPSAEGFSIFDDMTVRYNGTTISLNDLEHKIIRPAFKDPRIHVALCNAAISCPPLSNHAYQGATLEKTLDAEMKRFIDDKTRNQIDLTGRKLVLSSIFDWYGSDFGGRSALTDYVAGYLDKSDDLKGFTIEFLPYDWHLNIVRK